MYYEFLKKPPYIYVPLCATYPVVLHRRIEREAMYLSQKHKAKSELVSRLRTPFIMKTYSEGPQFCRSELKVSGKCVASCEDVLRLK